MPFQPRRPEAAATSKTGLATSVANAGAVGTKKIEGGRKKEEKKKSPRAVLFGLLVGNPFFLSNLNFFDCL